MITYTKRGWGLGLLFRTYGSAIPRSCPAALASTALAVYLSWYRNEWVRSIWLSPFPYQMFGTIVGFIVVFRCGAQYPLCTHIPLRMHVSAAHAFRCACTGSAGTPYSCKTTAESQDQLVRN